MLVSHKLMPFGEKNSSTQFDCCILIAVKSFAHCFPNPIPGQPNPFEDPLSDVCHKPKTQWRNLYLETMYKWIYFNFFFFKAFNADALRYAKQPKPIDIHQLKKVILGILIQRLNLEVIIRDTIFSSLALTQQKIACQHLGHNWPASFGGGDIAWYVGIFLARDGPSGQPHQAFLVNFNRNRCIASYCGGAQTVHGVGLDSGLEWKNCVQGKQVEAWRPHPKVQKFHDLSNTNSSPFWLPSSPKHDWRRKWDFC